MPDIVLFMASKVVGGTSFWIRLTSSGSISCIRSANSGLLERSKLKLKASPIGGGPSEEEARRGGGSFLRLGEGRRRTEGLSEREEGR